MPERAPRSLRWHLLVDPDGRPGHENMALDYALLRQAEEGVGVLRLYRWTPACLSFGRNEPALRRYDRHTIERLGIDVVRRPTGGRAVWHDREVTYAVIAPLDTFGSLHATYRAIHAMLADALTVLGLPVSLAPTTRQRAASLDTGACFASPVGGEVIVGKDKLVGSAQLREGRAFLQHGSLLLENGQDLIGRITRGRPAPEPRATSLQHALDRPIGFCEVAGIIENAAMAAWPGEWIANSLSTSTQAHCSFEDSAWTWRR